MQRFLYLMHLNSVGLGFSTKRGIRVVVDAPFYFNYPIFYFLNIPKNADPLPLIEA